METWKLAWRNGVAPCLSTKGLTALCAALGADDRRLIQNATTFPPPLEAAKDWPIAAACAVALACWQGSALSTVGEVETAFAYLCRDAGERLGEPEAIRWFLNWFDETDRSTMRRELLAEVTHTLADRGEAEPAAA